MEFDLSLLIFGCFVGLGAGLIGGTLAAIAGIGGGLIYVPILYAFMPASEQGMAIHIFGSLIAVVITAYFSSRAHWRLQHIDQASIYQLLPGLILGAAIGLWSTLQIPETYILLGLALLNGWIAYDYGQRFITISGKARFIPLFGAPIGLISGLFGIGGGTMLVPLLRRSLKLRYAVGTSAACGLFMALFAVLLNLALEPDWFQAIQQQLIFLAGLWLGVFLIIPVTTQWAAKLHGRMDEQYMRFILKTVFSLLSAALLIAALLSLL